MSEIKRVRPKLVFDKRPTDKDPAEIGRQCKLMVGDVAISGIMHEEISINPTEVNTLTITMLLPEIVYLDDEE